MNAEDVKQKEEAIVRFLKRLAGMADIKLGPKPSEEELERIRAVFNVVARVRRSVEEALNELERAEETLSRRLENDNSSKNNRNGSTLMAIA